jgi:phosphoribosylformimino-5-aminoimidazole carboxamide ribotide isomerase
MDIIPAIDIQDGRCVRLRQGDLADATVYGDDPAVMADRWVAEGARRLHLVDLDGAVAGTPRNADIIRRIRANHPELPTQVGGGIRDAETAAGYLEAGVGRVIIGTRAVADPDFVGDLCRDFPGRVIVGLDARDGLVATDGWEQTSQWSVIDLARRFEGDGVAAIIYTDIGRDGMLAGLALEETAALARATEIPIIASGGVSSLEDIRALCGVAEDGIVGAITGRAIYEGTLDLAAGQQLADELCPEGAA